MLNFLLLETLTVTDKFSLSGYMRKDTDNESSLSKDNEASSSTGMVCKKPEVRKYDLLCKYSF
jgi:hypothetical protein